MEHLEANGCLISKKNKSPDVQNHIHYGQRVIFQAEKQAQSEN